MSVLENLGRQDLKKNSRSAIVETEKIERFLTPLLGRASYNGNTSAFQADARGSIPLARSKQRRNLVTKDWASPAVAGASSSWYYLSFLPHPRGNNNRRDPARRIDFVLINAMTVVAAGQLMPGVPPDCDPGLLARSKIGHNGCWYRTCAKMYPVFCS